MKLALALGKRVSEIEQWPASEVLEWYQFHAEEPFGPERDNLHSAMICSILINQARGKKKRPVRPEQFMIKPAEDVRQNKLAQGIQWLMSKAKRKAT